MRPILLILAVFLCTTLDAIAAIDADMLIYEVEEEGSAPYESRILVTPDYLRMDEGQDESAAYTLFDRRSGVLYNLDPEDRTMVVIDPPRGPLSAAPIPLALSTQTVPDPQLPPVQGVRPHHVRLLVNGRVCTEVIAVAGVMNEAMAALAELYERLAGHHQQVVETMPDELLDACDLAGNVYAPRRVYEQGLPLRAWSARSVRKLVSHERARPVDETLFVVPENYLQYEIGPLPATGR